MSIDEVSRLAVFTICSNNYMPFAQTFFATLKSHHPEAECYLVLADEPMTGINYPPGVNLVAARDLGIPDFDVFAFQYDIMELNTALKPFAFLHIMEAKNYDAVLYFDPDIAVFAPLDAVLDPIYTGASFALTPHLCSPAEGDVQPDDVVIMQAGIYNLGFCGAGTGEESRRLINWWARRLRFQCINDQPSGVFVDQKFMDLVPGFAADARIVRDTTLNVAYWNLSQRRLETSHDDNGWLVDGRPLTFFHFSGFDPGQRDRLSKYTSLFSSGHPPALKRLVDFYAETLIGNGYGSIPRSTYAYGHFASGTPIHILMRKIFRTKFLPWDGNPFENFEAMLHRYAPGTARRVDGAVVTNFMRYLWDNSDWLRAIFDISQNEGARRYVETFLTTIAHDYQLDHRMTERSAERYGHRYPDIDRTRGRPHIGDGVTVVGYLKTRSGVGEIGRLTLRTLSGQGLRAHGFDVGLGVGGNREETAVDQLLSSSIDGGIHIYNINADQLPAVMDHVRPAIRRDAYRICVPFWELSEFPDDYVRALDAVDEVWAPSGFIVNALVKKYRKPVVRMPIALEFEEPQARSRAHFGLPDDAFLVFYSFDFLSFPERKNPAGVLEAFRKAFPSSATSKAALVLKTMNSHARGDFVEAFREEIKSDPRVILIDQTLSRSDHLALMKLCNATLSLHRSEGLGLLIAESMALGLPVIATDYSAATELVTPATGYPVEFKLEKVAPGAYPKWENQVWAAPSTDHAAWHLRRLYDGTASSAATVGRARAHLTSVYSAGAVAKRQRERLQQIGLC